MNERGRVLVVDDDASVRASLEAILSNDFDVDVAQVVAEALQILASKPLDVVVTDWQMLDGTGASILAVIRQKFPGVTSLVVTGNATFPEVQELQKGGRTLVLWKPVNPPDLIAWVRNGVAISRLQQILGTLLDSR